MGESACVMHTFSYASGISNEPKQGNPMHALGESVSFGRFMTESLSWEKWSTFSHNRYVEEAERYAKPGSVAQKKAFFEAHYKKIAAAKKAAADALLGQKAENIDPNPEVVSQDCTMVTHQSQSTTNLGAEVNSMKGADTVTESEVTHQRQSTTNLGTEVESMKGADTVTESEVVMNNLFKNESLNHSENFVNQTMDSEMENGESPQMEKPLLQGLKPYHEATLPSSKKKPAFSSSKQSTRHKAHKIPTSPAKSMLSIRPRKENNDVTPITRSSPTEAVNRKRSTSKSLRTLIYSTPAKEPDKSTSLAGRKAESSRVASSSYNSCNECKTPLRTPKTGYTDGGSKNPSATPFSENRRTRTPMDPSAVGSKTTGPRWNIISSVSSKSLTACRNKLQSPNLSAPFSFRTEERAARRKQKLEEKFNAKETQKVQLQTRLKEKAETEIKKFRQTLCFKARPMPDFYRPRESPINQIKSVKTPLTQPQSPKLGRKLSSSTLQGLVSLPQEAHSTKTSRSKRESHPGPRSTFRVGVTEDKNKKCRRTMEDTHAYLYNFLSTPAPALGTDATKKLRGSLTETPNASLPANQSVTETDNGYFAIFDGHAGTFAADWCGKKVHVLLEDIIRKNPNTPIPELLDQTFTNVDQQLEKLPLKNSGCTAVIAVLRWEDRIPNSQSATGSTAIAPAAAAAAKAASDSSSAKSSTTEPTSSQSQLDTMTGSTISATNTESKLREAASRQRVLYTANVGDARIVLCRNGKALRLSYDHKGSDENEGKRIASAGGLILNNRVNGVLAVTRALGDAYMKDLVTGHPYTTETVIQPDIDEFLILACDGLWDVCSDQEAVDLIRATQDPQAASRALVDHALARFSTDNLSCMVVRFDAQRVQQTVERKTEPIGVDGDALTQMGTMSEAEAIVLGQKQKLNDSGEALDSVAPEMLTVDEEDQEPGPELNAEALEAARKDKKPQPPIQTQI